MYDHAHLPTEFGYFYIYTLNSKDQKEHLVISTYSLSQKYHETPLVRIHSECLTGDVFHSLRCDCKEQLHKALRALKDEGERGVPGLIFYLRQEGRGIGLFNKIKAYHLQQTNGLDTQEANLALGLPDDARTYDMVAQFLKDHGIFQIKLMTNNPLKIKALEEEGITVIRKEHVIENTDHIKFYLETKKNKQGHML